jgi:hypothetical protein
MRMVYPFVGFRKRSSVLKREKRDNEKNGAASDKAGKDFLS